jgi:hypothetical protein
MTAEQLQAEALKLPTELRARLAEALIASLDDDTGPDRARDEEAERRYREYLARRNPSFPSPTGNRPG